MDRATKHLVIVTHRRIDEERSGSKTYLQRMMALAGEAGFQLTILCLPKTPFSSRPWGSVDPAFSDLAEIIWPETFKLGETYITLAPSVWSRFAIRSLQEVLQKLNLGPEAWRKPWSNLATIPPQSELDRIVWELMALKPDAVLVEYSSLGPILGALPDVMGKAVLVHDSFAARAELFQQRGIPSDYPNTPTYEEEAARMAVADVIFHASVRELQDFETLGPGSDHIWFRPTAPVHRDRLKTRTEAELLYVGANQQGSRDAIYHFITDIWPRVQVALSNAKLNIVGPVGPTLSNDLISDGIIVHGRVDDLTDFSGPDMIGLLPTRLMSGISIKVGEYLGMGLPIVAYPAGIEGYGTALDGCVQTASDPTEFASHIIRLLNDRNERDTLSAAGLDTAETILQNPEVISALKRLAE
ncbi:MAG: glycosyltransferase family 4 protein [Pseudomonadota bacterium]